MPEVSRPLLTIAIPTYNRAPYLRELLEQLLPQVVETQAPGTPEIVELIISDNASTDDTPDVTLWASSSGVPIQLFRQTENIGPDSNFTFCYNRARGKYFWIVGDDDILRPGGLGTILHVLRAGEYDLAFLAPQAFYSDWRSEWQPDPFGRGTQVIKSARHITRIINVGITFVSGVIVNRDRVVELGVEAPENFVGTFLVQLSWMLPNLRHHRQSVVLWQRVLSGRSLNSGGYNVADVFGERFLQVVHRILPDRPSLAAIFVDFALRRWFPATILELRQRAQDGHNTGVEATDSEVKLRRLFGSNIRFWIFTWPILHLSLSAAEKYLRVLDLLNKVIDWAQQPSDGLDKIRRKLASPDVSRAGIKP